MEAILKFVAKTGGIKINDSEEWINPTPEAKTDILNNLDKVKEMEGCLVDIILNEQGFYTGIKKISDKPKIADKPKSKLTETETKYKTMVLSYAKDLAIADKIKTEQIIETTEKFYKYIMGE